MRANLGREEKALLSALEAECAENASSALSQLLKKRVRVSKPKVLPLKKEDLPAGIFKPRELTASIQFNLFESLPATALLALKREDAARLVDLCLGKKTGTTKTLAGLGLSAFLETGGILTANIIATTANFFGVKITQAAPMPVFNTAGRIADFAQIGRRENMQHALVIKSSLSAGRRKMPVNYIVLISDRSLERFFSWVKKRAGETRP